MRNTLSRWIERKLAEGTTIPVTSASCAATMTTARPRTAEHG